MRVDSINNNDKSGLIFGISQPECDSSSNYCYNCIGISGKRDVNYNVTIQSDTIDIKDGDVIKIKWDYDYDKIW